MANFGRAFETLFEGHPVTRVPVYYPNGIRVMDGITGVESPLLHEGYVDLDTPSDLVTEAMIAEAIVAKYGQH